MAKKGGGPKRPPGKAAPKETRKASKGRSSGWQKPTKPPTNETRPPGLPPKKEQ